MKKMSAAAGRGWRTGQLFNLLFALLLCFMLLALISYVIIVFLCFVLRARFSN